MGARSWVSEITTNDRAPKALSVMSEGYSLAQSPFGWDLSFYPPLYFRSRRKRKDKEENIFFVW